MKQLRIGISRRTVIEAWVHYDARKKSHTVPDFQLWSWDNADYLDQQLERLGFKTGIIAGFLSWTFSAMTLEDLRRCAVVSHAVPGSPTCLGQLEGTDALQAWRPNRATDWYGPLNAGGALTEHEPLLIRRSVRSESPATWYLEDGSGRALAIVQTVQCRSFDAVVGYAYVAGVPDGASAFMRRHFPQLLE